MKNTKQLTLTSEQFTTIVNRLYDIYPIPDNCVVAGQSVSTLIDEQINGSDYFSEINDVDCFFPDSYYRDHNLILPVNFSQKWTSKVKSNNTDMILEQEDCSFGGVLGMQLYSRDDTYRILGTDKDQLGNHILFESYAYKKTKSMKEHAELLISGFDLNNVQVGIVISDGIPELIFTKAFEEFIYNRQLMACTVHTPVHTAIRITKKRRTLPHVFCDLNSEYTMLSLMMVNGGWHSVSTMFTDVFMPKYLAEKESLDTFFTLSNTQMEFDNVVKTLYSLSPKVPHKELSSLLGKLNLNVDATPILYRLMTNKLSNKQKTKFLRIVNHSDVLGLSAVCFGVDYMSGDVSEKAIKQIHKLCLRHPEIIPFLSRINTFENCYQSYKMLVQFALPEMKNGFELQKIKDVLVAKIQTTVLDNKVLIKRSFPSINVFGVHINELISQKELWTEAYQLHHCVAGYGTRIEKEYSKIVSIKIGDNSKHWATAEFKPEGKKQYLSQLRGNYNSDVSKPVRFILKLYCFVNPNLRYSHYENNSIQNKLRQLTRTVKYIIKSYSEGTFSSGFHLTLFKKHTN